MNIVILDDDLNFSSKLRKDVYNYFSTIEDHIEVSVINNEYSCAFKYESVDIFFLDIDLKTNYNGIILAKHLKEAFPNAIIVFISNHEECVFPALSIGFFQFIRKGHYSYDSNKVFRQIHQYLLDNIKKIIVTINDEKEVLKLSEIVYIMSIGHDLFIKTINKDFIIPTSLKKFMLNINYLDLVQIQKGLIININFVTSLKLNQVTLMSQDKFNIGRTYRENFFKRYEEYLMR